MASVHDVAAYILQKQGEMTAMKLQKLVYYSQAWGLVWDEEPLFPEQIQAWANGPVVPELYAWHKGLFKVNATTPDPRGNPEALTPVQTDTIDQVLRYYGGKTAQWLSDLTHAEDPWKVSRSDAGLGPGERGTTLITHSAMAEYYGSL